MYRTYDLILAMSIGWALYGMLNIIIRKNNKENYRVYSIAIIVCMTVPIIDNLIKPTPKNLNILLPILAFTRNIYYFIGPLIWLYVTSLVDSRRRNKKVIVIHFFPFLVWVVLSFIFLNFPQMHNIKSPRLQNVNYFSIIRLMGFSLSVIIYSVYSLYLIKKHKSNGQSFYTNKNMNNTLSWLTVLILFMASAHLTYFLHECIKLIFNIKLLQNSAQILTITPIIFLFFFSFYSTKQSIPKDTKSGFKPKKYKKSTLDDSVVEKVYTDLLKLIESKKLYLNSELTIEDISLELHISKHKTSQIINQRTGNNFYTFINNYRVEEFKIAVKEDRYPLYKIIDIAFECGFNSSSVFYSFFKKAVNMTPKAYINSVT